MFSAIGKRLVYGPLMGILLCGGCLEAVAADRVSPAQFAEEMVALTDVILAKHIRPPARQQLLLSGARALYSADGGTVPVDLARRVSALSQDAEIHRFLQELAQEFPHPTRTRILFQEAMLREVPGNAGILPGGDAAVAEQLATNRYVGIGIALSMDRDEGPFVARVIPQGPAALAGLLANDQIQMIDEESTTGLSLTKVIKRLRGQRGTVVNLQVAQPNAEPRAIAIERDVTFIATVHGVDEGPDGTWNFLLEDAIAYLSVQQIGPSTVHELRTAERALRSHPIRGVILDLRHGGGRLHDTVQVADAWLETGTIGYVQHADGRSQFEAEPGSLFAELPLAVLIDQHANTDRVFLTAALQDQGRAKVVGRSPLGETFVHGFHDLPNGDRLRLAVGLVQRANGTLLFPPAGALAPRMVPLGAVRAEGVRPAEPNQSSVIVPDVIVPADAEVRPGKQDPWVERALKLLQRDDSALTHESS